MLDNLTVIDFAILIFCKFATLSIFAILKRLENAYLGEIEPVPALFEQIENNAPSRNKSWLNVTRIFIDFSKKIRIGSVSLIFQEGIIKKREHMLPTIKNASIQCFQNTEDFQKVQGWSSFRKESFAPPEDICVYIHLLGVYTYTWTTNSFAFTLP